MNSWVNKQHHAGFGLLVDDEHVRAKLVQGGLEAGLGIHVLWPTLCEVSVCGGQLTWCERFTSARLHYDAHKATSSPTNRPTIKIVVALSASRRGSERTPPATRSVPRRATVDSSFSLTLRTLHGVVI